jgi:hypothetical protein
MQDGIASSKSCLSGGAAVAPGRAVRFALALGSASKRIGLSLRADLHTGAAKAWSELAGKIEEI